MSNDNSEPDNYDRAAWADKAIVAFMGETGTDRPDALSDLIADLMHWADLEGVSFADALRNGKSHYAIEIDLAPRARPRTSR